MMKPLVSIVILNMNGKEVTRNCLRSIKEKTLHPNYEVIVVDNGSKDGSNEMIERRFKCVKLIKNKENVGFSAGNNQGFRKAKGKYFFMLNNDTLVTPKWLDEAVKLIESDKRIAAVGSELIGLDQYKQKRFEEKNDREARSVCGAAMMVKRSVMEEIGVLDAANYYPAYGEEVDWCYRARNAGYKIMQSGRSIVAHIGGITAKRQGKEKQVIEVEKSRIKAMALNHSIAEMVFRDLPSLSYLFLQGIIEGNAVYFLKAYWQSLKELNYLRRERKKKREEIKRILKKRKKSNY